MSNLSAEAVDEAVQAVRNGTTPMDCGHVIKKGEWFVYLRGGSTWCWPCSWQFRRP